MSENATPDRQPLLRDRNHKMIAGVCTGLGRHLDIDPVVFRILFAVLTFFGGLGILAYAACWLLIPAVGDQSSEAQRLLTGPNVYVAAGAAALMVLGLLWFTNILADRFDQSLPIVLAGAAAIGVVVWHRENRGDSAGSGSGSGSGNRRSGPGSGPIPGSPFAQPQAQAWWQRPVTDQVPPTAGGPHIPEPFRDGPASGNVEPGHPAGTDGRSTYTSAAGDSARASELSGNVEPGRAAGTDGRSTSSSVADDSAKASELSGIEDSVHAAPAADESDATFDGGMSGAARGAEDLGSPADGTSEAPEPTGRIEDHIEGRIEPAGREAVPGNTSSGVDEEL